MIIQGKYIDSIKRETEVIKENNKQEKHCDKNREIVESQKLNMKLWRRELDEISSFKLAMKKK